MNPLINILIRTSNSPDGFRRSYESVLKQGYDNIRIIVTADTIEAVAYVLEYDNIEFIDVRDKKVTKGPSHKHKPYNLYLNDLFEAVEDGWIFILDDDDWICDDNFFKKVSLYMDNPNNLLLWQMRMNGGRIIPEPDFICKPPVAKHIGMPCFSFHSDWKGLHTFNEGRRADFQLISKLYKIVNNKHCFKETFIQLGNDGREGKV